VCLDDYWSQWAKGMHIKNRWKAWCHMASRGWKGLRLRQQAPKCQ